MDKIKMKEALLQLTQAIENAAVAFDPVYEHDGNACERVEHQTMESFISALADEDDIDCEWVYETMLLDIIHDE